MKSVRTLAMGCALLAALSTCAQSRNDNWFLGRDAWMNFTGGSPQNMSGSPLWPARSAGLSDPAGNLLLVTLGDTPFNGAFLPVQGTVGLVTAFDTPQDNIILPLPNDPAKLVVVSKRYWNNGGYCGYITVDMTLNNGMGGTADTQIHNLTSQPVRAAFPLTAVPHANGVDYWLLLHEEGTDAFFSFLLTDQGFDTTAVVSHTGPVYPAQHNNGTMSASYQGDLLALTAHSFSVGVPGDSAEVGLFNFDAATGLLIHICNLPGFTRPKSAEFSPMGSKLYVADEIFVPPPRAHELWQYDLSDLDCTAILASRTRIHRDTIAQSFYSNSLLVLGLGPDGKVYYRHNYAQPYLGVVTQPDAPGLACAYVHQGYLALNDTLKSFPNQCKRYHDSGMPWTAVPEVEEAAHLFVWPQPLNATGWLRLPAGQVLDELQWCDALGRIVEEQTTSPVNGLELSSASMRSGLYCLRALHHGVLMASTRVLVVH